jgi:SAM-dependent methyltransferase
MSERPCRHGSGSQSAESVSVGAVEWGNLRRLQPISETWGFDRGLPIDRYYIEDFLRSHRRDIRGRVLEVKEPEYTRLFGEGVERSDVLDIDRDNPVATVIADLRRPDALPAQAYDCLVFTQTLHYIYEVAQAVANARRTLRPGGVLLATLPSVSRIDPKYGPDTDTWRFTSTSAKRLFSAEFGAQNVEVVAYGNVLACAGFLYGLATSELSTDELRQRDPYFPLLVCVRAQRVG